VNCVLYVVYCVVCYMLCVVCCELCVVKCMFVLCVVCCVVCCVLCVVCCVLCVVCCVLCVVCCVLCVVCCVLCVVCCMLCVVCCVLCVVCCLNLFFLVHRGLGLEGGEERYVLFWISYDSDVLGKGKVPQVNSDQVTKLRISSKLLSPQNAALVHLGQHENRLKFFLNFLNFLLTFCC